MDFQIIFFILVWYIGNIVYNKSNKSTGRLLEPSKGEYAMTISTVQLAVGFVVSLVCWVMYPPGATTGDIWALLPTGICSAGAHAASVFAMSAGGVAFGQVVKAAEPLFAAIVKGIFYGKPTPTEKMFWFGPMVFGIFLCCLKLPREMNLGGDIAAEISNVMAFKLDYSTGGLIGACVANTFAAFKGVENGKVMGSEEGKALKKRIGGNGPEIMQGANVFAVMNAISMIVSLPLVYFREKDVLGDFWSAATKPAEDGSMFNEGTKQLIYSGLAFYGYNMAVLLSLKKIDAVTSSVLNTAKRVFVIAVGMMFLGEPADTIKIIGCAICMIGVGGYSYTDAMIKAREEKAKKSK